MDFCGKPINSRSRFSEIVQRRCFRERDHAAKCDEYPFLAHLQEVAPRVASKIVRDATMTTGASWKSEDAGPNRILRWAMLLDDKALLAFKLDMSKLKEGVVRKLRDKAAPYDDCMRVALRLTADVYGMDNAPTPPAEVATYLRNAIGLPAPGQTVCLVCLERLDFALFERARRGKAEIESSHRNPRLHTPDNVGFAHRYCNIAQGDKSVDEFYGWIEGVLARARPRKP